MTQAQVIKPLSSLSKVIATRRLRRCASKYSFQLSADLCCCLKCIGWDFFFSWANGKQKTKKKAGFFARQRVRNLPWRTPKSWTELSQNWFMYSFRHVCHNWRRGWDEKSIESLHQISARLECSLKSQLSTSQTWPKFETKICTCCKARKLRWTKISCDNLRSIFI